MEKLTRISELEEKLKRSVPLHHPFRYLFYAICIWAAFAIVPPFHTLIGGEMVSGAVPAFWYLIFLYRGSKHISGRYYQNSSFRWLYGRTWSRSYLATIYCSDLVWMSFVHTAGFTYLLLTLDSNESILLHMLKGVPIAKFAIVTFLFQLSFRSLISCLRHLNTSFALPKYARNLLSESVTRCFRIPLQALIMLLIPGVLFLLPILYLLFSRPPGYLLALPGTTYLIITYFLVKSSEYIHHDIQPQQNNTKQQRGKLEAEKNAPVNWTSVVRSLWQAFSGYQKMFLLFRIVILLFLVCLLSIPNNPLRRYPHIVTIGIFYYFVMETSTSIYQKGNADLFMFKSNKLSFFYEKGIPITIPIKTGLFLSLFPLIITIFTLLHFSSSTGKTANFVFYVLFILGYVVVGITTARFLIQKNVWRHLYIFGFILWATFAADAGFYFLLSKTHTEDPYLFCLVYIGTSIPIFLLWTYAWIRTGSEQHIKELLWSNYKQA